MLAPEPGIEPGKRSFGSSAVPSTTPVCAQGLPPGMKHEYPTPCVVRGRKSFGLPTHPVLIISKPSPYQSCLALRMVMAHQSRRQFQGHFPSGTHELSKTKRRGQARPPVIPGAPACHPSTSTLPHQANKVNQSGMGFALFGINFAQL
jgi:hypothetical protein